MAASWAYQFLLVFVCAHTFLYPLVFAVYAYWVWTTFSAPWCYGPVGFALLYAASYNGAERRFARRWPAFVAMWRACHPYFPVRMLMWDGRRYTSEPNDGHLAVYNNGPSGRRFVFGIHPHGPLPVTASMMIPQLSQWEEIGRNIRFGTASAVFTVPFARDFYLWLGCVDASRAVCDNVLRQGLSLGVCPGGIEEMLARPSAATEEIVLSRRRGFVRLALKYRAALVPVFGFGERLAFRSSDACGDARRWMGAKWRVGLPIVWGRWFTLMPFSTPFTIVVGKPIDVSGAPEVPPKDDGTPGEPADETVNTYLQTYSDEVARLFDEHKEAAGFGSARLVIK